TLVGPPTPSPREDNVSSGTCWIQEPGPRNHSEPGTTLEGLLFEVRTGFEPSESVEFTAIHVDSRTDDPTRVDVIAREPVVIGANRMHSAAGPLTVED